MAKVKAVNTSEGSRRHRPALTPEGRENQLISLAEDLAEKQLREGTASSQVITHYLKLGTVREKYELEKLKRENALLEAKKEVMESSKKVEELYANAIRAFQSYNGQEEVMEDEY